MEPLREEVYRVIKREIITGEIKPGTVLSEQAIADRLEISRTPVREALARLRNDDLLLYVPQKGMSVRELTIRDFVEVSTLIRALQEFSVSELMRREEEFETAHIRKLHEEQIEVPDDPWRSFELNIEMHVAIINLINNERITRVARNMSQLMMLAGYVSSSTDFSRALKQVCKEHEEIVRALEQRDVAAFKLALQKHEQNGFRRMVR